MYLYKSNNVLK